jgi:iron complex outermembrane receptor protein
MPSPAFADVRPALAIGVDIALESQESEDVPIRDNGGIDPTDYAERVADRDGAAGHFSLPTLGYHCWRELDYLPATRDMLPVALAAHVRAGQRALDVGCHQGATAFYLAALGLRVLGVDINPRAIEAARQRQPDAPSLCRPEFVVADFLRDRVAAAGSLDVVVLNRFLQMGITTTRPLRVFPAGADFTLIGGSAFPNGMLGAPDKWERHTRLSAASVYSGFSDHRLRFGLGHDLLELYRTAENKNFTLLLGPPTALAGGFGPASGANLYLSPHSRRVNYLYLQDEWSFAREWTLTAGVRHDRYSDFGGTTNPRVALVWEARPDLTAKLLYGSAFRAPSFVELYAAANPVALGNPQLQPEKIRTVEASLTWQPSPAIQTTLSLFRHEISDLIRQNATTYVNAGRQRGHGGEWEFAWIPGSRLRLSGHYAYQKNIDETTHRDAGLAPHHHAYARADWQFAGDWALGAQANWVADRQRTPGDNRDRIPDYTTLDLTLRSTRAWSGWDVSATIRNLFNADVREPSLLNPALPNFGIVDDFPMPRRTFWIQGRYAL